MIRFSMDWPELSLQVVITFAHFLWQACLVGFVLLVVQYAGESIRDSLLLRRRNSRVNRGETELRGANSRYTIACLAFFSLPICVGVTFTWVHQSRGSFVLVSTVKRDSPSYPSVPGDEAIATMANNDDPILPSSATTRDAKVSATKAIEPPTLVAVPEPTPPQHIQASAPYLFFAYMVGVAGMLARLSISIIGSSRLRRTIQPITDASLLKTIAEQCARVGLRRVPIVAICQRVSMPVVVGIVKPMILLPPSLLCGLDPNQVAAILSHEMAHIRRYDMIINLLQRIFEALLFFHPVTWWISRRVSMERENCCDDVAADCMGRLPYAGALLQMAELCIGNDRRRSSSLATLSASGGNSTDFGYRIRRLIGDEETTRVGFTRRSFSIGLAFVSLLTVSLVAWGQNQQTEKETTADIAAQKIFTPEPLWQTKLSAEDVGSEMFRISPVVVASGRVLSIENDFDLQSGRLHPNPFSRLPRTYEFKVTLDPVMRRKSSDRAFIVEVSHRMPGNTWTMASSDVRVLRAADLHQVGTTITTAGLFNMSSAVDVENGGDFLVLAMGDEVHVYRTETGQIETTMPVKTKRVDAVAISPDRQWLVVSDQNDLHFWRWRDQAPVKTIYAGRKIDSLVFTPDGQYLAEGPDTREDIQLRDMRTLEVMASLQDEVASPLMVSSMDITPDGRYLVAHNEVSVDPKKLTIPHRIHVWDLRTRGKPVFQIATGEWVRKVEFSDDGRMIVGEFSGAAHGALLAAWPLPDEIIQRRVDSPSDAKDRLGDGIQWSRWGDKNGLLSGARLILPADGLNPGQPLVVEYRLANVSTEFKTLNCYLNDGMQFTSLGRGNRISGFSFDRQRELVTLNLMPNEVFIDTEHLVSIDTTGLEPGRYQAALGSAFFYPDSTEPKATHEIPHRGSMPFTIVGHPTANIIELPKSDIHWGKPIAGLQVGARLEGDPTAYAIGAIIEADLFVANVTDRPIECSVLLPHPGDGWLFNVEDKTGSTIMLELRTPLDFFSPQRYIHLKLAPGEMAAITGENVRVSYSSTATDDAFETILPKVQFQVVGSKEEAEQPSLDGDKGILGRLISQGGEYSAIIDVAILRPEIPALRLVLDTGNVPFSVGLLEHKPVSFFGALDLKDEEVAAFVIKTLTKPYQPKLGGGSWQLGAHDFSISMTLASIRQQEMVADALMNAIEFSFGNLDSHARKLAMDYCAHKFPDRLLPYLVRRLNANNFPELDLSIIGGQAIPAYDDLTILGDIGERAKTVIPALTKHLSASDPIAREATIRSLVRVGPRDPEVMLSLTKCFNDNNERVQSTAVYEAGRYGELAKPLGSKFVELLEAKSKEVQFWAAAALITSEFNPDLGFEKLLAGAKEGEQTDRQQALTALAMLGHRSAEVLPELQRMLSDSDPAVVREITETIRRIETNDRIVTHAEEAEKRANSPQTGALNGRITLAGVLPTIPKLRVPSPTSPRLSKQANDEDRNKYEASLVEIEDESLQIGPEQGLANAFVYLAEAPSHWQSTNAVLTPLAFTIQDYRFEPRAAIIRTGQDVRLNNSGAAADNFSFEPMNNSAQNRMVNAGSELTLKQPFTSPEAIPIQAQSSVNTWKTSFLLPLDHPFAAITDKQGRFSIEGLPPGEHPLLIWHEQTGWLEESLVVAIRAGQTTQVNRRYNVERFHMAAHQTQTNSNWITAPQVCVGKAYSDSAKAANWKWDMEQRVSLATPDSSEMLASCLPGAAADFVVQVKLKLIDDAQCRLTIGSTTFDVTNSTEHTKLVIDNKEHTFQNDDAARQWTALRVQRRGNAISIQVNEQPAVDLGTTARAIPLISLQSTRGTIAVNNFVVTGNVQQVKQSQVAPNTNANNNETRANDKITDTSKQRYKLIDGETDNPLQGLECRAMIVKLNAPPRYQACTTNENGVVEVVIAEGESAGIIEVPSGWFTKGSGPVLVVAVPESEQQSQLAGETNSDEPTVLKLWRGTEVDGRLLWPDKTPAAGVKLTAGVYIDNQSWKENLDMDLTWYSFDHGDWPNWSRTITTNEDGKFHVTVPPQNSRSWLRIGTTQLGFSPQTGFGQNDAVTRRLAKCKPLEIQYGGISRSNNLIVNDISGSNDMVLHTGELQLETGVIVRGRVIDAEGKGLSNVWLTSTGPHGPHSGRSTTSGEEGKFEFPAMAAGSLTVHADARLRDLTKALPEQVISRDVQAVFTDQAFTIPSVFLPHEIVVRAVPHAEITFEWIDRRADKTQPIAYYGAFDVRGFMPDDSGKPATYWTSETELVERDGKQWLSVKIPTQLLKPELMLVADSKVTASYSDSTGLTSGPGIIGLGDITANTTRTIFGDDPLQAKTPPAN